MNDDLLKKAGGGNYWHELLTRIRDIRSSEKMIYRQVLDLYATSVDYDPRTSESREFFKIGKIKSTMPRMGILPQKSSRNVQTPSYQIWD